MAAFQFFKCIHLTQPREGLDEISAILERDLAKYFAAGAVKKIDGARILLNGNLAGTFERAITKGDITLELHGEELRIKAAATVGFGTATWVCLIIGLVIPLLLFVYLWMMIYYMSSRTKPKLYIEEVLNSLEAMLGRSASRDLAVSSLQSAQAVTTSTVSVVEQLERLAALYEKRVLSEAEFQSEKKKLLSSMGNAR